MKASTLTETLRNEGIRGLWKGNFVNCIRIFPQNAINYACYSYAKEHIFTNINDNKLLHFLSGSFGGMIAMGTIYPLENIRTRLSLQSNNSYYSGIIDSLRKIPLRHLYQGLGMSLLGFMPYNGFNFMFYMTYKDLFDYENASNMKRLAIGGISGASAVSLTYPTDLIRRRLQIQGVDTCVPKYNGIYDCIKKIIKHEGITGLYQGLGACYLKIFPAVAFQFYTMEAMKKYLK